MEGLAGIRKYEQVREFFPGVEKFEPKSVERLAFHLASNQIENEILDKLKPTKHTENWRGLVELIIQDVNEWRAALPPPTSRYEFSKQISAKYCNFEA